jgi:hypothetical protein
MTVLTEERKQLLEELKSIVSDIDLNVPAIRTAIVVMLTSLILTAAEEKNRELRELKISVITEVLTRFGAFGELLADKLFELYNTGKAENEL